VNHRSPNGYFADPNQISPIILNSIGFFTAVIDFAEQLFDSRMMAFANY
jgi:hypothetical protein